MKKNTLVAIFLLSFISMSLAAVMCVALFNPAMAQSATIEKTAKCPGQITYVHPIAEEIVNDICYQKALDAVRIIYSQFTHMSCPPLEIHAASVTTDQVTLDVNLHIWHVEVRRSNAECAVNNAESTAK